MAIMHQDNSWCRQPVESVKVIHASGQEFSRQILLTILEACADCADAEVAHTEADAALLNFINDDEIRAAYQKVMRWHA